MKKISCALLLLAITKYTATAQFYVDAGLGYAMPQAGQTTYNTPIPFNGFPSGYSGTRNNTSAQVYTYNIKSASFSAGLLADLGMGYFISDHVGVQMNATIGVSNRKYTFKDNNVNLGTAASPLPGTISTTQQAKTPVLLTPALILQTGGKKLNLYTRLGLVLPLNTKITQDIVISNAPGTGALVVDAFSWQIKSSFSLGFAAGVGLKYKLSEKTAIWCELSFLSISANTKEQDLKSWTENGRSVSLLQYPYAQHIKYSKTATVDTNFASFPTYSQPFSNFGIKAGVSFNLAERRKKGENRFSSDEGVEIKKPFKRR